MLARQHGHVRGRFARFPPKRGQQRTETTLQRFLVAGLTADEVGANAQGVAAPQALAGPRFELFSMTAAAAACGMGLALVPRLLIAQELAQGTLVVACDRALANARAYYLVQPEGPDRPPAVQRLLDWLLQATAAAN